VSDIGKVMGPLQLNGGMEQQASGPPGGTEIGKWRVRPLAKVMGRPGLGWRRTAITTTGPTAMPISGLVGIIMAGAPRRSAGHGSVPFSVALRLVTMS
jgi:hypothetical protein